MKLENYLETISHESARLEAKTHARKTGIPWNIGIRTIFSGLLENPGIAPGGIKESKNSPLTPIGKWVEKYKKGYDGRPSQRESNSPGTTPDPIIDNIIQSRITHLTSNDLENIKFGHRLGMSAENILGLILEEYLSENLLHAGWHCAWGETAKSIDFIHTDGSMLQVKNRSNSENSSSSKVRAGTSIEKWHRIDAKTGKCEWESLNKKCGISTLSEKGFVTFTKKLLAQNPTAMAVEPTNSWLTKSQSDE